MLSAIFVLMGGYFGYKFAKVEPQVKAWWDKWRKRIPFLGDKNEN